MCDITYHSLASTFTGTHVNTHTRTHTTCVSEHVSACSCAHTHIHTQATSGAILESMPCPSEVRPYHQSTSCRASSFSPLARSRSTSASRLSFPGSQAGACLSLLLPGDVGLHKSNARFLVPLTVPGRAPSCAVGLKPKSGGLLS